ncbi:MAG: PaaI family thioesterase [bacterium]|nr:PaaI family thioesterase [bacterium]
MSKDLSKHIEHMEQSIPFNRHIGFTVVEAREGYVKVRVPFRKEFIGDPRRPALHGGILSAVIDAAGGLAVWTQFALTDLISTVDMRVDYLRPGPDRDIVAESRVVRMGNRVSVVNTVVYAADSPDEPVADGRAVYNTRRRTDPPSSRQEGGYGVAGTETGEQSKAQSPKSKVQSPKSKVQSPNPLEKQCCRDSGDLVKT